jgi:hypothetical protein
VSEHEHELPPDPDLDDLPEELLRAEGPLTLTGTDEDGNVWTGPVAKDDLARGFADRRRVVDADDDPA